MNSPFCFILMPFGKKPDAHGLMIDFDAVYRELIQPAVIEALFTTHCSMNEYLIGR